MKFRATLVIVVMLALAGCIIPYVQDKQVEDLRGQVVQLREQSIDQARRTATHEEMLHTLNQGPNYDALQAISVRVGCGKGCGSGVLVTRQVGDVTRTYVWTAGHVAALLRQRAGQFNNATIYQEIRKDGFLKGTVTTEAAVIAYSHEVAGEDLALLAILKDNFAPLSVSATFTLDDQPLPVGTALVHVGCTLGIYNSVSLGIVSQTDRDLLQTGKAFDQTTCMGYPGSSGGGVYLASNGKCMGLLTRGAGAGLNWVVPTRRMLVWAKMMGIEWAMNPDCKMPMRTIRVETPIEDGTHPNPVAPSAEEPALAPRRITVIVPLHR